LDLFSSGRFNPVTNVGELSWVNTLAMQTYYKPQEGDLCAVKSALVMVENKIGSIEPIDNSADVGSMLFAIA